MVQHNPSVKNRGMTGNAQKTGHCECLGQEGSPVIGETQIPDEGEWPDRGRCGEPQSADPLERADPGERRFTQKARKEIYHAGVLQV